MRTAVEMLDRLKPFSQFVVMTATLTTKSMDLLKGDTWRTVCQPNARRSNEFAVHKEKTYTGG